LVAHPDDEIIFAGGAMLSHAGESWTVVFATHPEGSPRAAEARRACARLRGLGVDVSCRFLGHADMPLHPTGGIEPPRLLSELAQLTVKPGERLYTHGSPGEYGHAGHKTVNWAAGEIFGFTAAASVFSGGGEILERIVDPALMREKARIFSECYPSQQGVWTGLAMLMAAVMAEEPHALFR
jgi:LmbE family N-acetylglucosaminyl deacetylase